MLRLIYEVCNEFEFKFSVNWKMGVVKFFGYFIFVYINLLCFYCLFFVYIMEINKLFRMIFERRRVNDLRYDNNI